MSHSTAVSELHNKSRTVWTQEVMSPLQFSGLAPGQNYCVVANISFPTFTVAASPKSAPQCVQTVSRSGPLLPVLFLGVGLTSLVLVPLLTVFLRKLNPAATTAENQPKTPPPSTLVTSTWNLLMTNSPSNPPPTRTRPRCTPAILSVTMPAPVQRTGTAEGGSWSEARTLVSASQLFSEETCDKWGLKD